jgi:hypothetical protein
MTAKIPLSETSPPHVVEFTADGTGVGKSFSAWRTRYHYELAGIPTTLVRIESRGVEKALRKTDIFIPVESFAQAGRMPGGLAGVLQPLFATVASATKTKSAVIIDWAGGLARHRAEILAATRFDERLAELDVIGLSFVVTTNGTDRMKQAAENLRTVKQAAPGLLRCLLLNKRFGGFSFIAGSDPAAVYRDLLKAAQDGCGTVTLPAIAGESWKYCEDAGLTLPQVMSFTSGEIAKRTGLDAFTATACATEVAAFWDLSEKELSRVLRFRAASAA